MSKSKLARRLQLLERSLVEDANWPEEKASSFVDKIYKEIENQGQGVREPTG